MRFCEKRSYTQITSPNMVIKGELFARWNIANRENTGARLARDIPNLSNAVRVAAVINEAR